MRKLVFTLFILILVAMGGLLFAPNLIPASAYKPQIESAASSALGRTVTMAGDMNFSFFPRIEVLVQDVTVANTDWGQADNLASIAELGLGLELLPLLSGELALQRFTLTDPVINLETDSSGRSNWDLPSAQETSAPAGSSAEGGDASRASAVQDIRLGDVQLINGKISQTTPAGTDVYENINIVVGLESLDLPMSVAGSLGYQNTPISLSVDLSNPRSITDGGPSDLDVKLRSDLVTASFGGALDNQASDINLLGDIDLDIPSVAKFMKVFTGSNDGLEHLERLNLTGQMDANGARANFKSLSLALEGMTGRGDLSLIYNTARPFASGTLKFDSLDFNKLIGLTGYSEESPTGGSGSPGQQVSVPSGGSGQAPAAGDDWSTEPIDFSGLKAFNADLNLSADKLFFQDLKFAKSDLDLKVQNGIATADLKKIALYEGSGSGVLKVNARKPVAVIESKFTLDNLLTLPFLADAAGLDNLEGIGTFSYDVTTRGVNERQLIRNLSGSSKLNVVDGAWKGVNLAEMSRTVQGFLKKKNDNEDAGQDSVGDDEKTDFSQLGGTFAISKGVVQNKDFSMLSPFVRVTGDGNVNLVRQTVDFRLRPKFVDSAAGQGGDVDLSGVTVPILVEGPIDNIRYRADVGAALQEALIPGSAGQSTEDVLKGVLGDLIGGDKKKDGEDQGDEEKKSNSNDLLKDLLGLD